MSDTYKERHPLLCEDHSDVEDHTQNTSLQFQQRFRHSSGRARIHAKGAAAIINRWPDHLSSLLTYWWIGLAMVAVMVFVIYNTIITIAALPPTHIRPLKYQRPYTIKTKSYENSTIHNVFMHVFVMHYDEFNINDYKPYVEKISEEYSNFKYNFIAVLNDVTQDIVHDVSNEQNNEIAMNSLWNYNNVDDNQEKFKKFNVQFISLTKYMDDSPLKKYWRLVPHQFYGFLIRCVAIWDQGGVAFNPLILTPNTPNPVYMKKVKHVLDDLQPTKSPMSTKRKKIVKKNKKKVNNIRDIINNMENNDESNNNFPDNLSEAENKDIAIVKNPNLKSKFKRNVKSFSSSPSKTSKNLLNELRYSTYNKTDSDIYNIRHDSTNSMKTPLFKNNTQVGNDITTKQNLFPKFLDFLFNGKIKNFTNNSIDSKHLISSTPTHLLPLNNNLTSSTHIINLSNSRIKSKNKNDKDKIATKLIIDLKGNLIATETPCHAFIGTLFSNIFHYTDEESVTDFIIAELSTFCNGFLSSCSGVEILLL